MNKGREAGKEGREAWRKITQGIIGQWKDLDFTLMRWGGQKRALSRGVEGSEWLPSGQQTESVRVEVGDQL